MSTFREINLETPHSQDVGFWGSKDIWDMAKIWIFSENTTPWMKDIEDLRMYELLCSFGEHLKTPHLQDVGYWGFKDISILSTFRENNLETPHIQDVGSWGFEDIWNMAKI